ncbi:MAG TPA: hypothetical protein VHN99_07960 [Deinococcales bacterium]|nr:hypothetical protein [Deinococcales bacterium]
MRKYLLAGLVAVTLAACVPSLNGPAATDTQNYPNGMQPLTLDRQGANVEVVFNAGQADAEEGALVISGTDLTLLAPKDGSCVVVPPVIQCALPTVPAGKSFVVTVAGQNVRANASWYRPGSLVLVGPVRAVPLVK